MIQFSAVVIASSQPRVLGAFYARVFGRAPDVEDDGCLGWRIGGAFLTVRPHREATGWAAEPARVLLAFETEQVTEEFARIAGAGALAVEAPHRTEGTPGWVATLADPDGNHIQLTSPAASPMNPAAAPSVVAPVPARQAALAGR